MQRNELDTKQLVSQLKRHEGFRKFPYLDTVGKLTIGYGWNLEDEGIDEEFAELWLQRKLAQVEYRCQKEFPWFSNLSPNRQNVVMNMVYNLGIEGFKKFRKTINFMERNLPDDAAREMLDSKWATQVGGRALELARQYREG